METGTLHHLARRLIEMAEGKKPKLSPLAGDDSLRLRQIESWLLEAVAENPALLLDIGMRNQAFELCRAPVGDTKQEFRVPPEDTRVKSFGEAQIAMTLHLAKIPYRYEAEFPVPEEHRTKKGSEYHPDFYLPDHPDESSAAVHEPPAAALAYQPDHPDESSAAVQEPTAAALAYQPHHREKLPATIEGGIWLEHFGNDAEGQPPPEYAEKYRKERRWKEKLHASLKTRFTWTEYGDIQRCYQTRTSFPDLLLRRIAALGRAKAETPSSWDVRRELKRLRSEENAEEHWRISYEIDKWIRTVRQQVKGEDRIRAALRRRESAEEVGALYRLASPVLRSYEEHLEESGTVDHEGTILKGWQYARQRAVKLPWTVILVDEYQDVNPAQAAFVHALLRPEEPGCPSIGARLTAVGDDWQAIFGFQGGDIELIRELCDPMGEQERCKEQVTLKQTYRFGQPLADTTRAFVTKGWNALDREVVGAPERKPDSRWPSSIVIASSKLTAEGQRCFGSGHGGLTGGVLAALKRIEEQSKWAKVLIIGRRNVDLMGSEQSGMRAIGIDRKTIDKAAKQAGIELTCSTIHKAKGIEADYVIMLDTGPPRAGESAGNRALERAMRAFWKEGAAAEEERRIWYVALTRAKHKLYLIVAAEIESHSPFADELYYNQDGRYDVGEDELAAFLEPMRPPVPCPSCESRGRSAEVLSIRDGRNGRFVGCTSYSAGPEHYCGHAERLCEHCGEGLMIRLGNGRARCQNPNCATEVPLCRCRIPRPMAKRQNQKTGQQFWGCQRYGMADSCGDAKPCPSEQPSAS